MEYEHTFSDIFVPGTVSKWAEKNGFSIASFDDYIDVLLKMVGNPYISRDRFKQELWKRVNFTKKKVADGQVVRLVNKRFTGNLYVITRRTNRGFDAYNQALPQYHFTDLDYDSIAEIVSF